MSRNDDDLAGEEDLSPRQRAAVDRFRGRTGRYQRDRITPTNRDISERLHRAEDDNERRRFDR
jgi:hypothetical protein